MISLSELTPPLYHRVKRKLTRMGILPGRVYEHPYFALPTNLEVKWGIDIGANIGLMTKKALETYPQAKFVCFEPEEDNFKELTKNLAHFKDRVFLRQEAVSNVNGTIDLNISNFYGAHSIYKQAARHKEFNPEVSDVAIKKIQSVTLDSLTDKLPAQWFDFIKVDIEGAEFDFLEGGKNFLANQVDCVLIEVSYMRDTSKNLDNFYKILTFFREIGFSLINIVDLCQIHGADIPLLQFDALFRKTSKI